MTFLADTFGLANPNNDSLYDAFGWSIYTGNVQYSKTLQYSCNFRADKTDAQGCTYLMLAAQLNRPDAVALLIKINQEFSYPQLKPGYLNDNFYTAFAYAISNRSYEALYELVKHADEAEINDRFGSNPLAMAIEAADPEAVAIILQHPQVSLDCPVGSKLPSVSVLEFAQNFGNSDILQLFSARK